MLEPSDKGTGVGVFGGKKDLLKSQTNEYVP